MEDKEKTTRKVEELLKELGELQRKSNGIVGQINGLVSTSEGLREVNILHYDDGYEIKVEGHYWPVWSGTFQDFEMSVLGDVLKALGIKCETHWMKQRLY